MIFLAGKKALNKFKGSALQLAGYVARDSFIPQALLIRLKSYDNSGDDYSSDVPLENPS